MMSKIWDVDLTRTERRTLLHAVHAQRMAFLIRIEVYKEWRDLLPSTQALLQGVDWCDVLGGGGCVNCGSPRHSAPKCPQI
jgi:hypothetical protein